MKAIGLPFPLCLAVLLTLAGCSGDRLDAEAAVTNGWGLTFSLLDIARQKRIDVIQEYVVVCRSHATTDSPGDRRDFVPPGSTFVGRVQFWEVRSSRGGTEREQAVHHARDSLEFDQGQVVWRHNKAFRVSLDRCATWLEFSPAKEIPHHEVLLSGGRRCDSQECAEIPLHNHGVAFRDFRVQRRKPHPDRISFVVESSALERSSRRQVVSEDGGKTWQVSEAPEDPAAVSWKPDPRRLVVAAPAQRIPGAPAHALTDEDLAKIPTPEVDAERARLLIEMKGAARMGDIERLERARLQGAQPTGEALEAFREALLEAMAAKGYRR